METDVIPIARAFRGRRLVVAEFMYRPRPVEGRVRQVFDYTLTARLRALDSRDGVLIVADSAETVESLSGILALFPDLAIRSILVNPARAKHQPDLPYRLNWPEPEAWHPYTMTDRWSRISAALSVAGAVDGSSWLVMPAHDAIYSAELLSDLIRLSETHARNGQPAAVSPYTYHQHSAIPGVAIPGNVIELVNTAFGRDALFGWKLRLDRVQGFWGKMGMIPFGVCALLLTQVDRTTWEDDLQIDSKLRRMGYDVRGLWVGDPAHYRQALPVFDRADVRRVIERTLHYSLNIPSARIGESSLNFRLGALGRLRRFNPHFKRLNREAEAMIAACNREIAERLTRYGYSWVDWGAYRYVMRVGDPEVAVWGR